MNAIEVAEICVHDAVEGLDFPKAIKTYCGNYYSPYYALVYFLMKNVNPKIALELGVETGRFSFAALQVEEAQVIGLDTHETVAARNLSFINSRFVYLIQASSTVPTYVLGNNKISILHVDTEHSYSMAKMEFETYFPYLARPAYVLFDDTHAANNDVLKYVNELPYYKILEDRLHPVCGYAVVVLE